MIPGQLKLDYTRKLSTGEQGRLLETTELLTSLAELLTYDPDTGHVHWKELKGKRKNPVGFTALGYRIIRLEGLTGRRQYRAHRIAYALHHGHWPTGEIDHINGNRTDNRISNLRDVTGSTNKRNRPGRSNTGILGVHKSRDPSHHRKPYASSIALDGRTTRLGWYATLDEATATRQHAEELHFPGTYQRTHNQ